MTDVLGAPWNFLKVIRLTGNKIWIKISLFQELKWLHLEYRNWRPVIVWSHRWIKQPFASCSCCCSSSCWFWSSTTSNPSNWSSWSSNWMDCLSELYWLGSSNSIGWCGKPGVNSISVNDGWNWSGWSLNWMNCCNRWRSCPRVWWFVTYANL